MKQRLLRAVRWVIARLPEGFLFFFLASLLPGVYLLLRFAARQWGVFTEDRGFYVRSILRKPWPVIAGLICIVAGGLLAVVLWRSRGAIWAVARKMIIEAMHRKIVVVLLVFFVVLMPSLPFVLHTEGSIKSQVQIVFSYALTLAIGLLSLVAIFLATASVCSEIEKKQIHITDSKPLWRWQFLLGKLVGIVVMCAALLFVMAGSVYGLVRYLARERDYSLLSEWEVRKMADQRQKVFNEVLVTRTSHTVPLPDVSKQVEKRLEEERESGRIKVYMSEEDARKRLGRYFLMASQSVPPYYAKMFAVEGLHPQKEGFVYVRFKLLDSVRTSTSRRMLSGTWVLYQWRESEEAGQKAKDRRLLPYRSLGGRWKAAGVHEVPIPATAIDDNGVLYLGYRNEENVPVIVDPEFGLEILQQSEEFFANYYRSLIVLLFHIALLAALGLAAGAVFSFPVASLLVFFVFVAGLLGPWFTYLLGSRLTDFYTIKDYKTFGPLLDWLTKLFLHTFFAIMPHFGKYNPVEDLVNGRLVSWAFVASGGAVLFFTRGLICLLAGIYIYTRRELARVQV